MIKLIKTDLKRVLKDKLFLVMCILGFVFALITPLLYIFIVKGLDEEMVALTGLIPTAKAQFFSAFSLGNNFGFIGPILLSIILCKDFSHGTVRNKIISGHGRTSIFLSMYAACFTVLFVMTLLQALVTFGISVAFFEYDTDGFTASDIGYILGSLGLECLLYLAVAALVCWLVANMKNVGLVIVLYVAILMALTMIGSILPVVTMALEASGTGKTAIKIIEVAQNLNIFNYGMYIGTGTAYTTKELLYYILTPTVLTAGFLSGGILKFCRKDLK